MRRISLIQHLYVPCLCGLPYSQMNVEARVRLADNAILAKGERASGNEFSRCLAANFSILNDTKKAYRRYYELMGFERAKKIITVTR